MAGKHTKHTKRTVAAIIAAALVAHGKGTPENIAEAIRVYRACLDGLNKPETVPDPEWSKEDQAAIDRADTEARERTV
jgi:hypothetical protein